MFAEQGMEEPNKFFTGFVYAREVSRKEKTGRGENAFVDSNNARKKHVRDRKSIVLDPFHRRRSKPALLINHINKDRYDFVANKYSPNDLMLRHERRGFFYMHDILQLKRFLYPHGQTRRVFQSR